MEFLTSKGGQYLVQVVAHGFLATIVVEALLGFWVVQRPDTRIRFRLLILVLPLLGWPIYQLAYPERGSSDFRANLALIDIDRWLALHVGPVPMTALFFGLMGAATVLFVIQQLAPTIRHHFLNPDELRPARAEDRSRVLALMPSQTPGGSNWQPDILVASTADPVVYTLGAKQHSIVVSPSLLESTDPEEMESILAHERAHAARRDNTKGWVVLGLGALAFYSPVIIFALRNIAAEVEKACDDVAVHVTRRPLALASGLLKVASTSRAPVLRPSPSSWMHRANHVARRVLIEERLKRLVDYKPPKPLPAEDLRFALVALLLTGLFFFVV